MAIDTRVAVLGAGGTMGLAMSRNLAQAGFAVTAWNRSREKAEPLQADGVRVVDSPAEAVYEAAHFASPWRQRTPASWKRPRNATTWICRCSPPFGSDSRRAPSGTVMRTCPRHTSRVPPS